ncbi:unnamed protein product, partial [Porites lobata]
ENSSIKLPVLTRSRKTYKEENKNLQVLLRGIQCFNLTYQNLLPEMPHKSSQTESSATRDSHVCLLDDSRDITQENGPNCDQSREESVPIDKDVEKEKDNFLPLQSLFKSSYKDSWIPRKDSSFIRNSTFKAIIQQPVVFLRQPSPVAGVKMTLLKEHEATIAAAIQTVKKRNVQTPSVDAEVSPHIKKIYVKGKSALSPQKEGKTGEENSAKIILHEVKTTVEISTSGKEKHVRNSQLNFPDLSLTSQGAKGNQDQSVLPALLCIRSLNFSPQLLHMWNKPNSSLPPSSRGSRSSRTTTEQDKKDSSIKTTNNTLPLLSLTTTLKGKCLLSQRKQGLNEQQYEEKNGNYIKPSELNECEKRKTSTPNGKHQTTIKMASTKTGKQITRTVFYLPKADKYDITPDGKYTSSKVCRAIKVEDLKASLIRSDRKDSWVPSVDKQLMKFSVFKAIMQQPTVFLRQPSPVKGLKMPL